MPVVASSVLYTQATVSEEEIDCYQISHLIALSVFACFHNLLTKSTFQIPLQRTEAKM